jgi:hypothetical protein
MVKDVNLYNMFLAFLTPVKFFQNGKKEIVKFKNEMKLFLGFLIARMRK